MTQVLKKIGASVLAIVVLFSTLSFTINQHYCGDVLVDSAILSKAETCGMEMETSDTSEDCAISKKNCCLEVIQVIEGQQELKTQISDLTFSQKTFVVAFLGSHLQLFPRSLEQIVPFKSYIPPLITKDIQVLDEVFII